MVRQVFEGGQQGEWSDFFIVEKSYTQRYNGSRHGKDQVKRSADERGHKYDTRQDDRYLTHHEARREQSDADVYAQ